MSRQQVNNFDFVTFRWFFSTLVSFFWAYSFEKICCLSILFNKNHWLFILTLVIKKNTVRVSARLLFDSSVEQRLNTFTVDSSQRALSDQNFSPLLTHLGVIIFVFPFTCVIDKKPLCFTFFMTTERRVMNCKRRR